MIKRKGKNNIMTEKYNKYLLKKNIFKKNKKIIIYGAGIYATIFQIYLHLEKMQECIEYFLVSNKKNNPQQIGGKAVKELFDVQEELNNYPIFIAMKRDVGQKVYYTLQELGVTDISLLDGEFMQEIYNEIFDKFKQLPMQRNKVFVECFAGLGYRCNCKYIVEELLENQKDVEIIWSVSDLKENMPKSIRLVQRYSLDYFKELYTSGIWIGNDGHSSLVRKRREQYYINTWHGTGPFKKVNASLHEGDENRRKFFEDQNRIIDLFISNSSDNTEMFRESFCYNGEIYECGSPRNDVFFTENNIKEKIYLELGINTNKRIVLYAPTFRDGDTRSFEYYDLCMDQILQALYDRFQEEFVLLYRFHHRLYKYEKCKNFYTDGYNVTMYPDMQELLVAADVLITDYSSVMWDFSLQKKPVFLYHNDQTEYENDRGFYCPPREWPYPQAHSHDEMIEIINNFDEEKYHQNLSNFFNKYKSFDDGHASKKVVERIMDVIEHPQKYGKE